MGRVLIFIIFILYLFIPIKIKLTFKPISLVGIKNYLLIINKSTEKLSFNCGYNYKIIYFSNMLIVLVKSERNLLI